jgi:hypothetical protein
MPLSYHRTALICIVSGFPHIPPDLVVGRLSTTLIASRGEDLQVEHPV